MLAQNFKTADELKIDAKVYEGLKKVLVRLETGDLVHIKNTQNPEVPNGFNMRRTLIETGCGTIGCIGGWAAHEIRWEWSKVLHIIKLGRLFYPQDHFDNIKNYDLITAEQAAQALRHYLTTGEIDWSHVKQRRRVK